MTLYFENAVNFPESGAISTDCVWHASAPMLAVASYFQEKGGFVTIFDELGQPLSGVNYPSHPRSQVSGLAWHPERTILVCGWENGELFVWNGVDEEFGNAGGPHKAPITLLEFSEKGGRLVSCDTAGSLVGWKMDANGALITVYHHDFRETITHICFRLTIKHHPDYDIEGLAKAAVNGDEHALDIFSNWRPKTTARKFRFSTGIDNHCFYAGTQNGSLFYVEERGNCFEVLNTEGMPLTYVMHHPSKEALVVMMEGLTIGYFGVGLNGNLSEVLKVKLSGRLQYSSGGCGQGLTWAGGGALAILTGELIVRIWNLETNDNYILPMTTTTTTKPPLNDRNATLTEYFTCIGYCKLNQTLCAGTNVGRLYFWSRKPFVDNPEDTWELTHTTGISGTVKQLAWGSVHLRFPVLTLNCVTVVYVMKEQSLCASFGERVWAVQTGACQLALEAEGAACSLKTELQITDLCVNAHLVVVSNGRSVGVYEIVWEKKGIGAKFLSTFNCDNENILLHNKNVVVLFSKGVTIRSATGIIVANIPFLTNEGEPIGIDVNGNYLTIFTLDGFIKLYDLSEHEPKLVTPVRNLYDFCNDFGEIIQARGNSAGNKIALTLAGIDLIPDGKLYVWNVEEETLKTFDFHKYGDYVTDEGLEAVEKDIDDTAAWYEEICSSRIPLAVYWDFEDPRLLVCCAKKLKVAPLATNKDLKNEDQILITMFISSDHGILVQDIKPTPTDTRLLAVSTPHIALLHKQTIRKQTMTDFVGLENCNKGTRTAILDFSYNLSLGNMDEAFKAIKTVQNVGVWNSLARMCVKMKRLDVAGVCLGHMGDARAARALRMAVGDKTLPVEAKLAVLAVQLGMLDEAEQLYIKCERYDLLNKLLQSRNKMEEAIKIAETKDRIHLKNTYHAWARKLEQNGDLREAAKMYEKANTHRYDVPRMFVAHPELLESYMAKTSDPGLLKWWGQYLESQGNLNAALRVYSNASDIYSQVRILCYQGDETLAADLAKTSNDKAAFSHLARHYETAGNIQDAVAFFVRAGAFSNAVRLCKEHNMADELWNIGMVAGGREKLECARYFEEVEDLEKAVILYHRAGLLHKALDLAFKTSHYDTLLQIATDLDANSDPALIKKCSDYFMANEQFDKAVNLLAVGRKYQDAIDLCVEHNVQLTEDLVEKLTPEKGAIDEHARIAILEKLAESLMLQGNYHLATKKFTQAGDKIKGMKSLLKSGDTEKIIFFANVSRQKEIYIMAANYLQSLDWQNKPDVLRNIIAFYSKGKSLDLLANFYVACAQVEIDEFQNYEKAYGAMMEASRCLAKVAPPREGGQQHRRAGEIVQQRLGDIKKFIDVRRLFERGDVQSGLMQSRQLLTAGGAALEESVRRGDIYGLMIQNCVKSGNFSEAKNLFDELQHFLSKSSTPITYYVNKETIESLARGLNVPVGGLLPAAAQKVVGGSKGEEGEIQEEITEE